MTALQDEIEGQDLGTRFQGRSGHGRLRARRTIGAWRTFPAVNAARGHVSAAAEQPDLLLLDEPTNHLDAETVSWLEGHLRTYPGAILIVTARRATSSTMSPAGFSSSIAGAASL